MANRERGELTLVAGAERYTLRLTTNSCCEVEDFTGGRTSDDLIDGINKGSFKDARLMLWMALRCHHPEVATADPACLDAIGVLIDRAGGRNAVLKTLRALIQINTDIPRKVGGPRPLEAQHDRAGVVSTLTH